MMLFITMDEAFHPLCRNVDRAVNVPISLDFSSSSTLVRGIMNLPNDFLFLVPCTPFTWKCIIADS